MIITTTKYGLMENKGINNIYFNDPLLLIKIIYVVERIKKYKTGIEPHDNPKGEQNSNI